MKQCPPLAEKLDENVAKMHFLALSAELTVLTQEQADYVGTQRECNRTKLSLINAEKCSNLEFLLEQLKRITRVGKTLRKNSRLVVRHGRTCSRCVERSCELANKKTEQLQVSTPFLDDHHFEEELESVGELSKVCSYIVLKCLYLARIGRHDILWSVNKLARAVTKRTRA